MGTYTETVDEIHTILRSFDNRLRSMEEKLDKFIKHGHPLSAAQHEMYTESLLAMAQAMSELNARAR